MGYKDRSRLMDEEDKRKVITNSGIVHPTVLIGGKLQAKWKRDGTKLIVTSFAGLSKKSRDSIASHGKRLFSDEVRDVMFQD